MINRKINLGDGHIVVTESKITHYLGSTHQSMNRDCIGLITSQPKVFMRKTTFHYSLRFMFFGAVICFISLFIDSLFLKIIGLVIGGYGFLALNIGAALGVMGFPKSELMLFKPLFGIKGHELAINNTCGGNRIIFNIYNNELNKKSLIQSYKTNPIETKTLSDSTPNDSLNEIEKISELFLKGILTEEEFIQKKKQLLNI